MAVLLNLANFLLATAMWLVLGRLVLGLFIRNPANPVWQLFLIATTPVDRVSRALTGDRVRPGRLWVVSLLWLLVARLIVARLARDLLT